jgi:uncharacterized phage protein (TIGR02218 family)
MSYDTQERSTQGGAPVELYEFTRGSSTDRFTSADADLTFETNLYTAATLQRSRVETTTERARNAITVRCAREFPIADLFRVAPPCDVIGLTVRRFHRGDNDPAVIWMGRVLNCEFSGSQAVLTCEPVSTSMKRPGLRRPYSRTCPHVFGSIGEGLCNLDLTTVDISTSVSAIGTSTITVAALGAYSYAGGYVSRTMPDGTTERRLILSASGLVLTLDRPFPGLAVSAAVVVVPGCNHTISTCNSVYANLVHYGGFPFIPTKNPFDGTPVY